MTAKLVALLACWLPPFLALAWREYREWHDVSVEWWERVEVER